MQHCDWVIVWKVKNINFPKSPAKYVFTPGSRHEKRYLMAAALSAEGHTPLAKHAFQWGGGTHTVLYLPGSFRIPTVCLEDYVLQLCGAQRLLHHPVALRNNIHIQSKVTAEASVQEKDVSCVLAHFLWTSMHTRYITCESQQASVRLVHGLNVQRDECFTTVRQGQKQATQTLERRVKNAVMPQVKLISTMHRTT